MNSFIDLTDIKSGEIFSIPNPDRIVLMRSITFTRNTGGETTVHKGTVIDLDSNLQIAVQESVEVVQSEIYAHRQKNPDANDSLSMMFNTMLKAIDQIRPHDEGEDEDS